MRVCKLPKKVGALLFFLCDIVGCTAIACWQVRPPGVCCFSGGLAYNRTNSTCEMNGEHLQNNTTSDIHAFGCCVYSCSLCGPYICVHASSPRKRKLHYKKHEEGRECTCLAHLPPIAWPLEDPSKKRAGANVDAGECKSGSCTMCLQTSRCLPQSY